MVQGFIYASQMFAIAVTPYAYAIDRTLKGMPLLSNSLHRLIYADDKTVILTSEIEPNKIQELFAVFETIDAIELNKDKTQALNF